MPSFSRIVKEEIVYNDFTDSNEKALICALIKITGTLDHSLLTIRSENAKIASKAFKIIKKHYHSDIEIVVSRKMKLKKNNVYYLKVKEASIIIEDLYTLKEEGSYPKEELLQTSDDIRAYLAGIFLGCGSVNDPSTSNYHLEMSLSEEYMAEYVKDLMNQYELNAKIIKRRNKFVVYIKSAEKIGDFLRAIGAYQSVMNFEMTRIDRSMANTINRWNNCDIANEEKAMSASQKQIGHIAYVMDQAGLEVLDPKTREIAYLRLENPELTLNELAEVYYETTGQTISKSGLHHRFKKIEQEAMRLQSMEEHK